MEQAVENFEHFVHSQKSATDPWAPTATVPYDFESRKQIEGIHPQLIKDVFQPKRVLDYGCGPGHLIVMLRWMGVETRGYEPSRQNIALEESLARVHIYRDLAWAGQDAYDLVVCREVIEHCTIRQIHKIVANLVRLSSRYIYVTTRFAKDPAHLLSVDGSDDLDPTHITMLTKPFLRTLFILEGCTSRPDLEVKMDWQQKGRCLVFEVGA